MGRIKYWSNTLQISSRKTPVFDKYVSMMTLSEELKPVGLENQEVWVRRHINFKWNLLQFWTIKCPIEGTQSEIVPSSKHLKQYHCQLRLWNKNSNLYFSRSTSWKIAITQNDKHFCSFSTPILRWRVFFMIFRNELPTSTGRVSIETSMEKRS